MCLACRKKVIPPEGQNEEAGPTAQPEFDPNEFVTALVNSELGQHIMSTYPNVRNAAAFVTQMMGSTLTTATTSTTTAATPNTTATTTTPIFSTAFGRLLIHMFVCMCIIFLFLIRFWLKI
jgi:hypothetical protein